jgi:hypothetical protein
MSKAKLLTGMRKYRKAGRNSALHRVYLKAFEPKMIYRTTKTENPTTTKKMVIRVLSKYAIREIASA